MNPDFVEAMNHSEESQFGIVNKRELTQLIETAREAVEQERQMRQRLIDMYERQLKIQDAEIQRLHARIAELESNSRAQYRSDFEESVANGWVYG